jgi:TatD DNase family protein
LAQQYPDYLYATAGIHPHDAEHFDGSSMAALSALVADNSVKAIGETGLDYYRDFSPRVRQREASVAAVEFGPVFLSLALGWGGGLGG